MAGHGVDARFHSEQCRKHAGPEIVDRQESILAVLGCDVERDTVQILALDREIAEVRKNVPADFGEFGRIVRADIEDLRLPLLGKSVEADREAYELPGA